MLVVEAYRRYVIYLTKHSRVHTIDYVFPFINDGFNI